MRSMRKMVGIVASLGVVALLLGSVVLTTLLSVVLGNGMSFAGRGGGTPPTGAVYGGDNAVLSIVGFLEIQGLKMMPG